MACHFHPRATCIVPAMYVGAMSGPPGVESEHLKIRVFVAGGQHDFTADKLLIDKDGSLLLYRIAAQDEKGTLLVVVAAFHPNGWQGIGNLSTGTTGDITAPMGFRPQRETTS